MTLVCTLWIETKNNNFLKCFIAWTNMWSLSVWKESTYSPILPNVNFFKFLNRFVISTRKMRGRDWNEDLRALAIYYFTAGNSECAISRMRNLSCNTVHWIIKNVLLSCSTCKWNSISISASLSLEKYWHVDLHF